MENQGTILIYEWRKEKEEQFLDFCESRKVKVKVVPVSSYSEALGVLAGIHGIKKNGKQDTGKLLGEEMMVFAGIDGQSMDVFLNDYKRAGIEPVQLKAVLTPYNIFWDSRQLYEELKKERETFGV